MTKIDRAGVGIVLLALAIVLFALATPGVPRPVQTQTLHLAAKHNDDISSAARKKARRKPPVVDSRSPYYLRPGVKPSFGYIGPPGYAGEYAWRKSIGQCVEDLGYGRWAACPSY
jgi:hypothetical protein